MFEGTITKRLLENFESEVLVLRSENTCQHRIAELLLNIAAALPANAISSLKKYQSDVWSKTMRLISKRQLAVTSEEFIHMSITSFKLLLDRKIVIGRRRKTWERRIHTCKSKHRPVLTKYNNWGRDHFYDNRYNDFHSLLDATCSYVNVTIPSSVTMFKSSPIFNCVNNATSNNTAETPPVLIDRISCTNLSYHEFVEYYEYPEITGIISYIPFEEICHTFNKSHLQVLKQQCRREFKLCTGYSGSDVTYN